MSTDWSALIAHTRSSLEKAPGFSSGPINVGDGERLASAGAGLALVGYGLKRRGGWGVLTALGGLVLLHRGYTGYCVVNDLMGRDSAHPAELRRGHEATRALRVDAPPASVAAAFADPATLHQLFAHLRGVEPVGASDARFLPKLTAQALGLPDALSATRSVDPDAGVVTWQSGDGGPVAFTLTARAGEARDGGTRLTLSARYSAAADVDPRRLSPDLARLLDADLARAGAVLQGLLTLRAPAPPEADAGPHPVDGDAGAEQAVPDGIDAEDALELPAGPAA